MKRLHACTAWQSACDVVTHKDPEKLQVSQIGTLESCWVPELSGAVAILASRHDRCAAEQGIQVGSESTSSIPKCDPSISR